MEKYINEMPLLVRNMLKGLCDENRQGILIYLLKNGSKSFIEISKDLKISKNNLSHHIKALMRYGLIYNFYDRNEFADKYSFYEISKLGNRMIYSLLNFLVPIPSKEEEVSQIEVSVLNAGEPSFYATSKGAFSFWGRKTELPYPVFVAGTGTIDEELNVRDLLKKKKNLLQIEQIWCE
jgi:DNA-binding HxlR family transcriptional regulator